MNRTVVASLTAALCLFAAAPAAQAVADGGSIAQAAKKHKKKKKKKRPRPAAPAPAGPATPGGPGPAGPAECVNDTFEPDGSYNARELEFTREDRPPLAGVICGADSDFFSVRIPPGGEFTAAADPEAGFDASLAVLSPVGSVLWTVNDAGSGGHESTTITNFGEGPERFYVEVTEGYPGETGSYAVSGHALPERPCAGDDSAEQDDDAYSATVLNWPEDLYISRFLCPGDRDFFEITLPPETSYQFEAGGSLDIAIEVYDGGSSPIQVQNSRDGAQTEYVQIGNYGGQPLTRWLAIVGATETETGSYSAGGSDT